MKILVTGCSGFIGSHLCEKLCRNGYFVFGIDNFDNYYHKKIKLENIISISKKQNFRFYETDITNSVLLKKNFKNEKIDIIIHLAARPGVRSSFENPFIYEKINCQGTLNMLELAKTVSAKKFIFASSSSVYGGCKNIPFRECETDLKPLSPYGITKIGAEKYCFAYHKNYNIPILCLRFFTVYGPRQRPDMAIHKFARLISDYKTIPVFGNGKTKRDYTFYSDVINAILNSLNVSFDFKILNIGNSKTIELIDVIIFLEEELKKKAKIKFLPLHPGDPFVTFSDISAARRLINYEPKFDFKEGIKIFVDWFKKNRDKYG